MVWRSVCLVAERCLGHIDRERLVLFAGAPHALTSSALISTIDS